MTSFGSTLKSLMTLLKIKNAVLAKAVQYDVSYISKWTSGRALPAEKNANAVISNIADCMIRNLSEDERQHLMERYHLEEPARSFDDITDVPNSAVSEKLKTLVQEELKTSYNQSLNLLQPAIKSEVEFQIEQLAVRSVRKIDMESAQKSVLVADLFSLCHECRLYLSGIINGRFAYLERMQGMDSNGGCNSYDKGCGIRVALDLSTISDEIYDTIYLVHTLTNGSARGLVLYDIPQAHGRILYAADKAEFLTGIIADESHLLSVNHSRGGELAHKLYRQLDAFCVQERLVFVKTSMREMMANNLYMQSLVSTRLDWLTGHITEHFLPQNLYVELAERLEQGERFKKNPGVPYSIINGVLATAKVRIVLYKAAFTKLIINGELDFFNTPVSVSNQQKKEILQNIHRMMDFPNVKLKIIDGNLNDDFQYVSDPCVFLSDSVGYLRLENGIVENYEYQDNLLLIRDQAMRTVFERFYEAVWNKDSDAARNKDGGLIISDKDKIVETLGSYTAQVDIMEVD